MLLSPDIENLKKLWMETFGDSREYVDLVYRLYHTKRFCIGFQDNAILQAALTGVPYLFKDHASGKRKHGLYLCGLATRPQFRKQGLMSRLIAEAEHRAKEDQFEFAFLIPANEHTERYYEKLGYRTVPNLICQPTSTGRRLEKYLSKDGKGSPAHIYENPKKSTDESVAPDFSILAEEITRFLNRVENEVRGISIRHSEKDLEGVLKECLISGGKITYWPEKGLAFMPEPNKVSLFLTAGELHENSLAWPAGVNKPDNFAETHIMVKPLNGHDCNISAFLLLN